VLSKESGAAFDGTIQVAVVNEAAKDFASYRYVLGDATLESCSDGIETKGEIKVADQAANVKVTIAACDALGNISEKTSATYVFVPTLPKYTVQSGGSNVTITPAGEQEVEKDSTITFNVTPDSGYVRDTAVSGTCGAGTWNGNQYTTAAITADCTVAFSASQIQIAVSASGQVSRPSGLPDGAPTFSLTIVPGQTGSATVGQTRSFTVTAPTQWHVVSTTVDGTCPQGSWTGNVYVTGALTANCTVQFAATTGEEVTFSAIQTILGTKTESNTKACFNCHRLNATSGKYEMTQSAELASTWDANDLPSLVDYASVVSNLDSTAGTARNYKTGSTDTGVAYKRVAAGDPANSWLCLKVMNGSGSTASVLSGTSVPSGWVVDANSTPKNAAMPLNGPSFLATADQEKICRWILQGAKNI
jgi:hypothetical protein